jgi:Tol biopolymer transport system component
MRHAPLQHPGGSAQGVVRPVLVIAVAIAVTITTTLDVLAQQTSTPARRHLVQTSNPPRFGELCFTSVRDNRYWDISLMDVASGTVRRITRQTFNLLACGWSPDGSRLVFMTNRDGNLEIYTMAADGSDWRRVTNTSGDKYGPEWSPDGRHIAYAEDVGGGVMQIFVVDPDGSNHVQLTSDTASGYGPMWSPDSTRIAYISGTELKVMNRDGSHPVSLYSDGATLQPSEWSPTGSHILFMSQRTGIFKLYTVRLSDGAIDSIPTGEYDAWDGRWSPDGSLISFYSYGINSVGFANGMFAVFLMNADGSNLRQVTTLTANDRSWHPVWRP